MLEDEVIATVDTRAAIDAQYWHHRLSASALTGVSRPYFGKPTKQQTGRHDSSERAEDCDTSPARKRRRKQRGASSKRIIENTPGLCDWVAELHRGWQNAVDATGHVGCIGRGVTEDRAFVAVDNGVGGPTRWSLSQWAALVGQLQSHVSTRGAGTNVPSSVPCSAVHLPNECNMWRLDPDQLFNRLVVHCGTRDARIEALERTWVIPPRCRFLMADVCGWSDVLVHELATLPEKAPPRVVHLISPRFCGCSSSSNSCSNSASTTGTSMTSSTTRPSTNSEGCKPRQQLRRGYRIITLDPPWANKSADRGKRYPTKAWELLPELPIPQLAASSTNSRCAGCLVAVWVTNKSSYWDWLVKTVFPRWGVCYITTWFWLKVCDDGSPVMPIESHRERKPFEPLVIGVIPPSSTNGSFSSDPSAHNVGAGASCADVGPTDWKTPDLRTSIGCDEERSYWLPPWRSARSPSDASSPGNVADGSGDMHGHDYYDEEQGELGEIWRVPLKQVFCSIPMVHSAKPHLDELLNRCFTRSRQHTRNRSGAANCQSICSHQDESVCVDGASSVVGGERLELFARCLRTVNTRGNILRKLRKPLVLDIRNSSNSDLAFSIGQGWTCAGNEVIAQQELAHTTGPESNRSSGGDSGHGSLATRGGSLSNCCTFVEAQHLPTSTSTP